MCFSLSASRQFELLSLFLLGLSRLSIDVGLGLNFLTGEFSFSFSNLKGLKALDVMLLLGAEVSSALNEVNTGGLSFFGDECIISETADVVENTSLLPARYSGTASYSIFHTVIKVPSLFMPLKVVRCWT